MSGQLIGTAAKAAGLNPRTLRFYERVGLLPHPARTRAGYRVYGDDALARLAFIGRAKDLGLNLKEIRVKLLDGVVAQARIEGKGEGVLRAGDIQGGPNLEVLNPDHPIATLSKEGKLQAGLTIKLGEEVIGAISVGGAPTGDADEACARAGLEKIRDRIR